jgi:hypothetical protein
MQRVREDIVVSQNRPSAKRSVKLTQEVRARLSLANCVHYGGTRLEQREGYEVAGKHDKIRLNIIDDTDSGFNWGHGEIRIEMEVAQMSDG